MFTIYGIAGETFRGTLEEMAQVRGLGQAANAHGINRRGPELGVPVPPLPRRGEGEHGGGGPAQPYGEALEPGPERHPVYLARQIMHREVVTVRATSPAEFAWYALAEHNIRQAPVLDDLGRLVGLVADRDLLRGLNIESGQVRDALRRTVAEVMSTPVVSVSPDTNVRRIARAMVEYGLGGVPVVDEPGALVGIVSRGDILKAVINDPPLSLWA